MMNHETVYITQSDSLGSSSVCLPGTQTSPPPHSFTSSAWDVTRMAYWLVWLWSTDQSPGILIMAKPLRFPGWLRMVQETPVRSYIPLVPKKPNGLVMRKSSHISWSQKTEHLFVHPGGCWNVSIVGNRNGQGRDTINLPSSCPYFRTITRLHRVSTRNDMPRF